MKIIIEKKSLLNGLSNVGKANGGRGSAITIFSAVYMETLDNKLMLRCTNGDMVIEHIVDNCEVILKGKICVEYHLFSQIVSKLPNGEITISLGEENLIELNCVRSNFQMVYQDGADFPTIPDINENINIEIQQTVLKEMINGVSYAAATDDTRPILQGVLFQGEIGKLNLVALDGYRLSARSVDIECNAEFNSIINSKSIIEVAKVLQDKMDEVIIKLTDNHMMFVIGNTRIYVRLMDGNYVKYNSLIPEDFNHVIHLNRLELVTCIERVALVGKEGGNLICLSFDNGRCTVSARSTIGKAREELKSNYNNDKTFEIAFSSKYLLDALKNLIGDEIRLSLIDPLRALVINEKSSINLILPIRNIVK